MRAVNQSNLQRINQWKAQIGQLVGRRIPADASADDRLEAIESATQLCDRRGVAGFDDMGLGNLTYVPPHRVAALIPDDPTDFAAWPSHGQWLALIDIVRDEEDQAERQSIIDAVRAGKSRSEVMSLIHEMYVVGSIGAKELEQLMTQHSQRRLSEAA
jgi:hypothetical protein